MTVQMMNKEPEYTYHLLRGALETFQKNISELDDSQFQQTQLVADKTYKLESMVLSTEEARDIVIPQSRIDEAMKQVSDRYDDYDLFLKDLAVNDLNEQILRSALHRELSFDAVMERIAVSTPDVTDEDVQIFYQLHKDQFTSPEKRTARHILITINSDYEENCRDVAYQRISEITKKLKRNSARFKSLARTHSECPTSMDGGKLSAVVSGTLFPELDTELFNMQEGEVSDVIETEMGFHVLLCEKINKSIAVPLSRARPRIKLLLEERQLKASQKAWLEELRSQNDG